MKRVMQKLGHATLIVLLTVVVPLGAAWRGAALLHEAETAPPEASPLPVRLEGGCRCPNNHRIPDEKLSGARTRPE